MMFLDGCGIGLPDSHNPFWEVKSPFLPLYEGFKNLSPNATIKPIDCLLGVPGEPQSASGQATLFSGINIAKKLKRHEPAFPGSEIRKTLYGQNLFKGLIEKGKRPTFINAYPMKDEFFKRGDIKLQEDGKLVVSSSISRRPLVSVTTTLLLANQMNPYGLSDLWKAKAIYQDYSNKLLLKQGLEVKTLTPDRAGEILAERSQHFDLTLYEYFQTDIYGHKKSYEECVELIKNLAIFIETVVNKMDQDTTLLITSDHGNLEDKSTKIHTMNEIPLLCFGKGRKFFPLKIASLVDVTPSIIHYLS